MATKREAKVTILCEWCGDVRECCRSDTKTCSNKCRSRLAEFIRLAGFPPDEMPGQKTAREAFNELVGFLLLAEKRRRERERAEFNRYAEKTYGRGKPTA